MRELEVLTEAEFLEFRTALSQFLSKCSQHDLTVEEEREIVVSKLAKWLLMDKAVSMTPEVLLPKAQYHAGIRIVDEATGKQVISLVLRRTREMSEGDFSQLQNFFWSTIGRAIRDNPEVIRDLQLGGVDVDIESGDLGGQQFAG